MMGAHGLPMQGPLPSQLELPFPAGLVCWYILWKANAVLASRHGLLSFSSEGSQEGIPLLRSRMIEFWESSPLIKYASIHPPPIQLLIDSRESSSGYPLRIKVAQVQWFKCELRMEEFDIKIAEWR